MNRFRGIPGKWIAFCIQSVNNTTMKKTILYIPAKQEYHIM